MKMSLTLILFMSLLILTLSMINSEKSASKMVFSLICMIMIMCIYMYNFNKSSWMGISMFLTLVGGLMVLFTMVASIYPKSIIQSYQMLNFMVLIAIQLLMTNTMSIEISNNQKYSFSYKLQFILMIILILNFMLTYISKLILTPTKPFRSA